LKKSLLIFLDFGNFEIPVCNIIARPLEASPEKDKKWAIKFYPQTHTTLEHTLKLNHVAENDMLFSKPNDNLICGKVLNLYCSASQVNAIINCTASNTVLFVFARQCLLNAKPNTKL